MKLKPGHTIDELTLPSIDGSQFDIKTLNKKRALVTFYRFASCPFCNLRINEIVKRNAMSEDIPLAKSESIGINLEQIIKSPGLKSDLLLEDGDIIIIPKKTTDKCLKKNA